MFYLIHYICHILYFLFPSFQASINENVVTQQKNTLKNNNEEYIKVDVLRKQENTQLWHFAEWSDHLTLTSRILTKESAIDEFNQQTLKEFMIKKQSLNYFNNLERSSYLVRFQSSKNIQKCLIFVPNIHPIYNKHTSNSRYPYSFIFAA